MNPHVILALALLGQPEAPKADPFSPSNAACDCAQTGVCTCDRTACTCPNCDANQKPRRVEGAIYPGDENVANPWRWTNANGGSWWRYNMATTPLLTPNRFLATPLGEACSSGR